MFDYDILIYDGDEYTEDEEMELIDQLAFDGELDEYDDWLNYEFGDPSELRFFYQDNGFNRGEIILWDNYYEYAHDRIQELIKNGVIIEN